MIRAGWAAALAAVALAGCVTQPAKVAGSLARGAAPLVELRDTPFYPQEKYECGPAALATVLGASGVVKQPDELVPLVYLPGRNGSLQVEMEAAPRRFGRIAYRLRPQFSDVLAEVGAGRPVLILHDYSLPLAPRWHYAVVVGYDASRNSVILRSGTEPRQLLSAWKFDRFWERAGSWAIVLVKPGELPASANWQNYLESAAAFEKNAAPADASKAFAAAVERWPDEPLAWTGLGTGRYRVGDWAGAVASYRAALRLDPTLSAVRNNLAMALLDLGCPAAAREALSRIDENKLPQAQRTAFEDTRRQVDQRQAGPSAYDPAVCAS